MKQTDMTNPYIRPFPRVVRIEPASQCNLACSHCPTGTVDMERGIMSSETFSQLIAQLEPHKDEIKVAVLYNGGEPLLNRAFPSMVKEVKALGIPFVKTVSNGMLLTEARCHEILDSGLDAMEFSLDGTSPEESNSIRRKSDYQTVVRNIKRLMQIRDERKMTSPKISISTTQFLNPEIDAERQKAAAPRFLVDEFSGPYQGKLEEMKAAFAHTWPDMNIDESLYAVYRDPKDTEDKNFCDQVLNVVTVRSNGDVVACCFDLTSKLVLGNILKEDLSAIWNNAHYRNLRKSIDTREYIDPCTNCSIVRPKEYLLLKNPASVGATPTNAVQSSASHPLKKA